MTRDRLDSLATAAELLGSTLANAEAYARQQDLLERMRSVDELKTVFLATASHELRTPVTAIVGFSTLLVDQWGRMPDERARTLVERIKANGTRLDVLIEQLLDFSRLERGLPQANDELLNLGATVQRILDDQPELTAQHALEVVVTEDCLVRGSSAAVERVVTNLVGNAAKYSPPGARITVTVRPDDGTALLVVDDEGSGVPAADRERIFSRFFRGRGDAVARTRGAGIGLAIVAEYAASMGGTAARHRRARRRRAVLRGLPVGRHRQPGGGRPGGPRRETRCRDYVISSVPIVAGGRGVWPWPPAWSSLLQNANDRGVDALTSAKLQQVQTTADSFNARVSSQLSASAGLSSRPWQLTLRSSSRPDGAEHASTSTRTPSPATTWSTPTADHLGHPAAAGAARQPLALVDVEDGHGTAGAAGRDRAARRGHRLDHRTAQLPLRHRHQSPARPSGARWSPSRRSPRTSAFEQEISQLAERGSSSAAWFFVDGTGRVVASTLETELGKTVEDARYVTTHSGVSHLGGRIVVTADIPTIGWRVVFRESESQFTGGLSGPLQTTGLILVLLLLVVGPDC